MTTAPTINSIWVLDLAPRRATAHCGDWTGSALFSTAQRTTCEEAYSSASRRCSEGHACVALHNFVASSSVQDISRAALLVRWHRRDVMIDSHDGTEVPRLAEEHRISAEAARNEAEHFRRLAEEAREVRDHHREALETVRQEREQFRDAAETARTAREEARIAAETARAAGEEARAATDAARQAIVDAVRATADALSASIDQMKVVEDLRRELRAVKDVNMIDRN